MHFAAIVAPNSDTAFMISLVWTCVCVLFASFFNRFSEVREPACHIQVLLVS